MSESEMREILEAVKVAYRDADSKATRFYSKMHMLAEARYLPALEFFTSCLDDSRGDWRGDCLEALGFHYLFPPDSALTTKIQRLLENDPDDEVRRIAAHILGIRSQWPNSALVKAMQDDPDKFVRRAAFSALLQLAKLPYPMRMREMKQMRDNEIEPTIERLKEILTTAGIEIDDLASSTSDSLEDNQSNEED